MSAAAQPAAEAPPSAIEVELTAKEMAEIKGKLDGIATKANDDAKPLLDRYALLELRSLDWLRRFGSAHAEKSKLLHGLTLEIMGTFGQSSSIDAAAVETFRLALLKAKQSSLLKKIFQKTVRWTLDGNAGAVIRAMKIPPKLLALYSACSITTNRTPTVTVRPKKKPPTAA